MSNYKIKVNIEIVECNDQTGNASEQDDGSFTMTIDEKDAISIDNSEQAMLSTAYPAMRKALAEHLEKVSQKKSLKKPRRKKSK